jgi:hypothetical protein
MMSGMVLTLSEAWRLGLAIAFCAAIFLSVCARAPQETVSGAELRRLVLSALLLYAVGGLAALSGHDWVAGFVYGAGIMVSALAAWLSRGRDQSDPPGGDQPLDDPSPPTPDDSPRLDWPAFEREFRDYARRGPGDAGGPREREREPSVS